MFCFNIIIKADLKKDILFNLILALHGFYHHRHLSSHPKTKKPLYLS